MPNDKDEKELNQIESEPATDEEWEKAGMEKVAPETNGTPTNDPDKPMNEQVILELDAVVRETYPDIDYSGAGDFSKEHELAMIDVAATKIVSLRNHVDEFNEMIEGAAILQPESVDVCIYRMLLKEKERSELDAEQWKHAARESLQESLNSVRHLERMESEAVRFREMSEELQAKLEEASRWKEDACKTIGELAKQKKELQAEAGAKSKEYRDMVAQRDGLNYRIEQMVEVTNSRDGQIKDLQKDADDWTEQWMATDDLLKETSAALDNRIEQIRVLYENIEALTQDRIKDKAALDKLQNYIDHYDLTADKFTIETVLLGPASEHEVVKAEGWEQVAKGFKKTLELSDQLLKRSLAKTGQLEDLLNGLTTDRDRLLNSNAELLSRPEPIDLYTNAADWERKYHEEVNSKTFYREKSGRLQAAVDILSKRRPLNPKDDNADFWRKKYEREMDEKSPESKHRREIEKLLERTIGATES